jgi:hypothetical protein
MSTKRKQDPSTTETIIVDRRLWSVLHNMCNRLTSLETAVGRLQNTAAPPKRTRKPKSAAQTLG